MTQWTNRQRFDVICVGDVAADTYIALDPNRVEVRNEAGGPRLVLPFGAKLPYDESLTVEAGGNAANVAVACSRLDLRVALASYLGADQLGRDLLAALHVEDVNTSLVRLDQRAATNRNFVLRLGQERTILVRHEEHDYDWPHLRPSEVPAWLYLSSVGRTTNSYEEQLVGWLDENPAIQLVFQPGTYQIDEGSGRLARLYRRATLIVCNRVEAGTILGTPDADVESLLRGLVALGPRQVVITDSGSGAHVADGAARYEVPAFTDDGTVVDRTGAGDAFAATVLAYVVRGAPFTEALLNASVNAASVAASVGTQAGLLRPNTLEARRSAAPPTFSLAEAVPTPS